MENRRVPRAAKVWAGVARARMRSRISRNALFWIACTLIASLGLWLAWPDEIVAQPNPYDQLRYLEMAEEIEA